MKRVLGVILAGGEGERLSILSIMRAKPAVPFGGKFRLIDFALSNCVNSDIHDVIALTQYNPRSLNDHIRVGRAWDLDRNVGGIRILQPYVSRGRPNQWYKGTADAVLRNIEVIQQSQADLVLILAGDHIYKMDYGPFVQAHRRHRADVTIAVRNVPLEETHRFGVLALDENDRVVDWQEKPKVPRSDLASMGIYVFSKRALANWLDESRPDFGAHVIPAMLAGGARVFGYRFDGYWRDVGTVESYWQANMDLLEDQPQFDLYDRDWLVLTRSEERAPAKLGPTASVHREPGQPRLRHLRDGRTLRPFAGRAGGPRGRRARQHHHGRHGHPGRRDRGPRDHRQGLLDRPECGDRRRDGHDAESPRADAPQHRDHVDRQTGRGAPRGAPGPQRDGLSPGAGGGLPKPGREERRHHLAPSAKPPSPDGRPPSPAARRAPPGRPPRRAGSRSPPPPDGGYTSRYAGQAQVRMAAGPGSSRGDSRS